MLDEFELTEKERIDNSNQLWDEIDREADACSSLSDSSINIASEKLPQENLSNKISREISPIYIFLAGGAGVHKVLNKLLLYKG